MDKYAALAERLPDTMTYVEVLTKTGWSWDKLHRLRKACHMQGTRVGRRYVLTRDQVIELLRLDEFPLL